MPRTTRTGGGHASLGACSDGLITGYVLKSIREALGLTQERLAGLLDVDKNTLQSWESARRSLMNTRVASYVHVRNRLGTLGAHPQLLSTMDAAMEADAFLSHVLQSEAAAPDPQEHPLGTWVVNRLFSEILRWPFTGQPPPGLEFTTKTLRRGPVPSSPSLARGDRQRFFDHLRYAAECCLSAASTPSAILLRRQVYYFLTWHQDGSVRKWLADLQRTERSRLSDQAGWSPQWVAARSLVVALARQGDKEPLHVFIERSLTGNDVCERANLNYWAYWIGATRLMQRSDTFMLDDYAADLGLALLRRLEERLLPDELLIDLYVHSVWALLTHSGRVLADDPTLATSLSHRAGMLLDDADLSSQSRRELEGIRYAVQILAPPPAASHRTGSPHGTA